LTFVIENKASCGALFFVPVLPRAVIFAQEETLGQPLRDETGDLPRDDAERCTGLVDIRRHCQSHCRKKWHAPPARPGRGAPALVLAPVIRVIARIETPAHDLGLDASSAAPTVRLTNNLVSLTMSRLKVVNN
jgi:hypothetical protein